MLELILIAGSAAISLLVMRGMTEKKTQGALTMLLELLAFGLVNLVLMLLLLHVRGYLRLDLSGGRAALQIGGGLVFPAAAGIAVFTGALAAFASKRLHVRAVVEKGSEEDE